MSKVEELLELMKENPDLPIVPMVGSEVVAGDDYGYWIGSWGTCEVTEYYLGNERVHFKDTADEEEVLEDLQGCRWGCTPDGKDIYDLSDEEWDELYKSIPWIKCIVVYIESY